MCFDFLVLRTFKERLTCSKNEIGPSMTPATKNWVSSDQNLVPRNFISQAGNPSVRKYLHFQYVQYFYCDDFFFRGSKSGRPLTAKRFKLGTQTLLQVVGKG